MQILNTRQEFQLKRKSQYLQTSDREKPKKHYK